MRLLQRLLLSLVGIRYCVLDICAVIVVLQTMRGANAIRVWLAMIVVLGLSRLVSNLIFLAVQREDTDR